MGCCHGDSAVNGVFPHLDVCLLWCCFVSCAWRGTMELPSGFPITNRATPSKYQNSSYGILYVKMPARRCCLIFCTIEWFLNTHSLVDGTGLFISFPDPQSEKCYTGTPTSQPQHTSLFCLGPISLYVACSSKWLHLYQKQLENSVFCYLLSNFLEINSFVVYTILTEYHYSHFFSFGPVSSFPCAGTLSVCVLNVSL